MQKDIGDDVHIGQSATLFQSVGKSAAIDKTTSDFDNANLKVKKKIEDLREAYDADIACYIPGKLDLVFQGMIENIKTIEQSAHTTYKDKRTLDFESILDKNCYTNLNRLHLCFPVTFRKLSNVTQDFSL